MVTVAKPWLICGYHGLTIVTMVFLVLFVVKPWLIFVRLQTFFFLQNVNPCQQNVIHLGNIIDATAFQHSKWNWESLVKVCVQAMRHCKCACNYWQLNTCNHYNTPLDGAELPSSFKILGLFSFNLFTSLVLIYHNESFLERDGVFVKKKRKEKKVACISANSGVLCLLIYYLGQD